MSSQETGQDAPKKDPKKDRYASNLEAIKEFISSEKYAFLQKKEPANAHIGPQGAGMDGSNLFLNGDRLFPLSIEEFVKRQIAAYFKKPLRVDFDKIPLHHVTSSLDYLQVTSSTELFNTYARLGHLLGRIQPISGGMLNAFTLITGIGSAVHISEILKKTNSRNLILCDYYIDILQATLDVCDWVGIVKIIKSRNGRIYFLIADDVENLAIAATQAMKEIDKGLLPGSYIFQHYDLDPQARLLANISLHFNDVKSYNGWMEDESMHLQNILAHLRPENNRGVPQNRFLYKNDKTEAEATDTRICIAGSGPSITSFLPVMKDYADRLFVISCGSSLKTLLEYGILPDLHVELENVVTVKDLLACIEDKQALKKMDLFASVTTNPDIATLFNRVYLFQREGGTTPRFIENYVAPLKASGRTAVNSGLAFALSRKASAIFLLGTDFAFGRDGAHHDKSTAYFSDAWKRKYGEFHEAEANISVRGTDDMAVKTTPVWNHMRFGVEAIIANHNQGSRIYNCGAGAHINGTIPLLAPEKMRLLIEDTEKNTEHFLIDDDHCHPITRQLYAEVSAEVRDFLKVLYGFSQNLVDRLDGNIKEIQTLEKLEALEIMLDQQFEQFFGQLASFPAPPKYSQILQSLLHEDLRKFYHILRHYILVAEDRRKQDVLKSLYSHLPYYLARGLGRFMVDIARHTKGHMDIYAAKAKTPGNILDLWLMWWQALSQPDPVEIVDVAEIMLSTYPQFSWIIEETAAWLILARKAPSWLQLVDRLVKQGRSEGHHHSCVQCGQKNVKVVEAIQHSYFYFLVSECDDCRHRFFTRKFMRMLLNQNLDVHLEDEAREKFILLLEECQARQA